ncbi:MAG: glycosyltransferase [Deltaproteobacteria bacterium]|nr:glycosyltransferase [Deltaproteobacteria bacterium]
MPGSSPTVSIGLPVYNGEAFVAAAIDSLLAQDHADLELVISDNASTDRTPMICEDYARRDPRVRFSRNDTNIGPNRNFLRVLELSSGEHFMWASHDDVWAPDYVKLLLAGFAAGDSVALSAGRTVYMTEEGEPSTVPSASAPPEHVESAPEVTRLLLQQHATSWFYGLFRRTVAIELMELLRDVPVWGGDLMILLRLCLRYPVVGDDRAIIHKRLRTHTSHQPKTPREWVRWQRTFAAGMLREVASARLPLPEATAVLGHLVPFLRKILFRKGAKGTALMWLRAAYQLGQGRDHA